MPKKPVDSHKHKGDKRPHIPSKEEAGYEEANPKTAEAGGTASYPKNPVVHRGQDPELFWMNKYGEGEDDGDDRLDVDIRSLYRHEHIAPEKLIEGLYRTVEEEPSADEQGDLFTPNALFGNALDRGELEKVSDYYTHSDGWSNRLILGDSLLVMNSLLEREGFAGQVQCIYIDPPYGIKYGSNWQIHLHNQSVDDGKDDHLTGEPEQIRAFRDTWELGIHSYLSYLRDRLIVAKELLQDSGSCFVQISDENVHLVRCLMDEVFGSGNFVNQITHLKTSSATVTLLPGTADYVIWYAKNREKTKYRPLYTKKESGGASGSKYTQVELPSGERRTATAEERTRPEILLKGARIFRVDNLMSQSEGRKKGPGAACWFPVELDGREFLPNERSRWKTNEEGMANLKSASRIHALKNSLGYVRYLDDFPVVQMMNVWTDIGGIQSRSDPKVFTVQTPTTAIQRCMLMTTDPGDLVLDPTCGSGTSAFVAEQWGRRWITIDTSRIALNLAKSRLTTSTYPFYYLHSDTEISRNVKDPRKKPKIIPRSESDQAHDLRQGFVYEQVPHITLGSIANDEPPKVETLYDKPYEDKKKLRVAGPFTVETLQNYDPISPEELARQRADDGDLAQFEDIIFEMLKSAGVKTGDKKENAVFTRIDRLASGALHAEGYYPSDNGERKAYLHVGPKFGTVAKRSVEDAVKECRTRGDADWLIILGFAFDSSIENIQEIGMGKFKVTKTRMHDDLLQEGLLKRDKKHASFVTIGEPDIGLAPALEDTKSSDHASQSAQPQYQVEIRGLNIYDPIADEVKDRDVHDIAYWMLDDDYDGSNFVVKQLFFCGGTRKEFAKWRDGLDALAKQKTKRAAEQTLKIEIDDEAFDRIYGHQSHPFPTPESGKIAVRVISQFGEETTKVLDVST